jgi:hypothetical protein
MPRPGLAWIVCFVPQDLHRTTITDAFAIVRLALFY